MKNATGMALALALKERGATLRAAAVAALSGALLAACGGGAATTENPVTSVTPPATYTGPPPATADVQAFNIWFEGEYLPWCSKMPGLVRVRRYLAMEGAPRHFILHEFEGTAFQEDPLWRALRKSKEWALCAMTYGAPALYKCVIKVP